MAVSYASNIYTKEKLFFLKLLFRWSGSVWQLLWVDFFFFALAYVGLAVMYHQLLSPTRRITFEAVIRSTGSIRTSVPLSFMLGFFVSSVLSRWWSMCMAIPWMHAPAFYAQGLIESCHKSKSDIARKVRITVLRYFNLAWILMMATISLHIKHRFGFMRPKNTREFKLTWRQRLELINSDAKVQKYFGKLITEEEMQVFARSAELSKDTDWTYTPEYWLPLGWANRIMRRAKNIGCIADERQFLWMVTIAQNFRNDLGIVWTYSEFNIPLVYTQVAVTAVYIFLFSTLLSTQLIESEVGLDRHSLVNGSRVDEPGSTTGVEVLSHIPILGSLEFIFYLGWFKIGMCLMNPLGKDKADLPLSEILNSNLKVSVKLGGAEDSLFPPGLTDNGEPEEQQLVDLFRTFDFNEVHSNDSFGTAEETEAHLTRALLKRLQRQGKDLVHHLDVFQLSSGAKAKAKANAERKEALKSLTKPQQQQHKFHQKQQKQQQKQGLVSLRPATLQHPRSASMMGPDTSSVNMSLGDDDSNILVLEVDADNHRDQQRRSDQQEQGIARAESLPLLSGDGRAASEPLV
ncbi:hypothetical protein BOX15_Mlig028808g1 [Macrostomum lignano]|uniref:Bestrophin homolog n=1 Tax=Macrostomum lignano TaxID=282301 RepID=A0A267FBA9_9PLAT|nr:hypothetical protein BOX15_Mlig028808g1 [Macrostomum lignano]